jgi:hypothetical protein
MTPAILLLSLALLMAGCSGEGPGREVSLNWEVRTPPGDEDASFEILVSDSACAPFERLEVEEDEDSVVIRAVGREVDEDCVLVEAKRPLVVQLDSPLRDRRVLRK